MSHMWQVNPVSKRREYQGDLLKLAQGVLEQPNGGQIVIEGGIERC